MKLFASAMLFALATWAQVDYTFSDGGNRVGYQLATDEVFSRATTFQSAKRIATHGEGSVFATSLARMRGSRAARAGALPVFYAKGDLPSAATLAAMPAATRAKRLATARRLGTPKLLVRMDPSRYAALAATGPVSMEKSLVEGWMTITYPDAFAALDAADTLQKSGGWEFTPIFAREFFIRQALKREVNDPLYVKQWHLTENDFTIGLGDAWDQVTGKGINIAVIDDAFDIDHEDLTNAYPVESGYHRNFKEDGPPNDPSPQKHTENHGTYCGGLAVATGFNSIGVIGVAPEARSMGLRFVGGTTTPEDAAGIALAWQPEGIFTHVSSNSWGPSDDGADDGRVSSVQLAGIAAGATKNRDGLGTVFAISAGNGRDEKDDQSYDGFSTSRFAIAVGAVGRNGVQSSYSESGMAVAVAAFGGEFAPPNVLWSTNVTGEEAFKYKVENYPTTTAPMNYTDAANGTSSAAPQVSGAAALLLEKNPKLGYRDVKEILMKSASKKNLQGTDDFVENGAGFSFSHAFGAGVINVAEALKLAAEWTNLGPLKSNSNSAEGAADIADGESVVATIPIDGVNLRVEHVEVKVSVTHANRGDLQFTITSPAGMKSIAQARPNDDNADFTDYVFTSVRHWGESANGEWKVEFKDTNANGVTGKVTATAITIYGTEK